MSDNKPRLSDMIRDLVTTHGMDSTLDGLGYFLAEQINTEKEAFPERSLDYLIQLKWNLANALCSYRRRYEDDELKELEP